MEVSMKQEFRNLSIIAACLILPLLSCSKQPSNDGASATSIAAKPSETPTPPLPAGKFVITGRLVKTDGLPEIGIELMFGAWTRRGKDSSFRYTLGKPTGPLLAQPVINPIAKTDDNGRFRIEVDPTSHLGKKGQEYILRTRGYEQWEKVGVRDFVLLFKVEGEPREINLGDVNLLMN